MVKLAAIDLGTVSSRLLCATMHDGAIVESRKHTVITDLGEGVDARGVFSAAAIERVMDACREFVDETRSYGASRVCTTLTSAARDVSNGDALLEQLGDLGLEPQVIPGEVEARLTFTVLRTISPASVSPWQIRAAARPKSWLGHMRPALRATLLHSSAPVRSISGAVG